jgi:hypothetical protein
MNTNRIVQRARQILVSPRTEWPVSAAEPATVPELYREYIAWLAAVPPLCRFVRISFIGYAWHGFRIYRLSPLAGLSQAVVGYLMSLMFVYVLALSIDAFVPGFGGQQSRIQAMKLTAFAMTAVWVAGIAQLLPGFAGLLTLAGAIYSGYLLYLGLPVMMRVPQEQAAGCTGVVVVVALLLGWLAYLLTGGLTGVGGYDAAD